MRDNLQDIDKFRVMHPLYKDMGDSRNMCIVIDSPVRNDKIFCICSDGGGWEHVSVSLRSKKMPCWDEMCFIKNLFWAEDETVIQFHPPEKEYVNNHATCLHMWKKIGFKMPLPDSLMIGIK
jgi:hypothetical protein